MLSSDMHAVLQNHHLNKEIGLCLKSFRRNQCKCRTISYLFISRPMIALLSMPYCTQGYRALYHLMCIFTINEAYKEHEHKQNHPNKYGKFDGSNGSI